ncbi:MAG: ACT domain-containing protein, partial [Tissierellia bacterium]|nr:ACT domain-containing protein [Tissierellia bacterium]
MIKQISILVENEVGTIFEVTDILAQNNINIKAFSVNDTSDFGILRLLVDEYEEAERVLRENEFGFKVGDVLAVELEHKP